MKRVLILSAAVLSLLATACAEDAEVREACADHGGVSAVSGSSIRKFVACKDGDYKTVR